MKSEWVRMSLATDKDRANCKSWFGGFADDMKGPHKAQLLERPDGKPAKLRASFTDGNGRMVELVRTFGRTFSVSIKPISPRGWL